ncbi:MAG: hypothetical protein ACN4E2_04755 [Nitrospinota bacterium]
MSEKKPDKDIEALSKAIVEAMLRDPVVRAAVNKITGKEQLDVTSLMVMTIKVKNLAESMGIKLVKTKSTTGQNSDSNLKPTKKVVKEKVKSIAPALLDEGKKLSEKELAFREYAAQRFDEKEWLIRNKLLL